MLKTMLEESIPRTRLKSPVTPMRQMSPRNMLGVMSPKAEESKVPDADMQLSPI
jgi:hypothetical protein